MSQLPDDLDKLPDNLQKLYALYTGWRDQYFQAKETLKIDDDDQIKQTLQMIEQILDRLRAKWYQMERVNLEKLVRKFQRVSDKGKSDFPHSIVAWYEDEQDDLWEGLA